MTWAIRATAERCVRAYGLTGEGGSCGLQIPCPASWVAWTRLYSATPFGFADERPLSWI